MQRYYCPAWSREASFFLSEEESRHCVSVMRNAVGDEVDVLDGIGNIIRAEITEAHPKRVRLAYGSTIKSNPTPNGLHIAISPTKSNDRFEWFLEKVCEIGVGQITPVLFDRTERTKINHDRWNKIIITSCKQSSQLYFPTLHPLTRMESFVTSRAEHSSIYVAAIGATDIFSRENKNREAIILIGPEGDFTDKERAVFKSIHAEEVSLSDNILRVETAGMVAATLWDARQM